jgi:hypothetical protein
MIILSIIAIQDFKHRAISWYLVPLLFVVFIVKSMAFCTITTLIKYSIFNLAFVCIQILMLTIYMSIKNKKWINIVNTHLGLGDLLFFVSLIAAFSPPNFIFFYIVSLLFSLVLFFAYKLFYKNASPEIPLAGLQSICLIGVCFYSSVFKELNFYDNSLVSYLQ